MIVKLLTEYHLEFLRVKGGCRGSSESTLVKKLNCWKSHAACDEYQNIMNWMKCCFSMLLRRVYYSTLLMTFIQTFPLPLLRNPLNLRY